MYFIAAKLLREGGLGPTLLVSPLLSLMRNQVEAASRMGVAAATINSSNPDDWPEIERAVTGGDVDILLVSPERLNNSRFRAEVLADLAGTIAMLVIDEAHCISDWGHDFRPHYRMLERIVVTLPPNMRLLATTATANNRVMDDLGSVLGPDLDVVRGDLNRPSLQLQSMRLDSQAERLAWLAEVVPTLPGQGIIYALTKRDAVQVAAWLASRGIDVHAYTGDTGEQREGLEQALLQNEVKALIATSALGMGFDKPDLGFVIHYQTPGSVVAYYQQVGRAGRALPSAYGVLLSGHEDDDIAEYFITSAFPTRQEVQLVLDLLEAEPSGLSVAEILQRVNISYARVVKTLELLSLESPAPVVKQDSKWVLTAAELTDEFWTRAERLAELRRAEKTQMQEYVDLETGHMAFLIRALDGDPGNLEAPQLPPLLTEPNEGIVREAIAFLRRSSLPIQRRKRWPDGGLPIYGLRGNISAVHQAEDGMALCVWGDAGWGRLVRRGKYTDGRFADELVGACERMIRDWHPQPAPVWVTCVPSRRHPDLVPEFASRLADRLGLPFVAVIEKTGDSPEQKLMENSAQQARNLDGMLAMCAEPPSDGAALLIDDMVDSRWTLTVATWLLRTNGVGQVYPVALAVAGRSDD